MEKNKRMQFYGGTFGACAPLLIFMCLMIVIAAMKKVSLVLFCMAGFAGLCAAFLLAKDKKEFEQAVVDGLKNDTLCVIIFAFLLAGILSQELRQSGLIQGLTWLVMKLGLSAGFLPLVAFLVCLLISTACGTSNGAIVAVLPVLLPVAATVGANPSVVVGAIVSGAIFGDNLAPISDTTIASALTQDAEVRDVVRTRLPYSLIAGVISAVLFIIVGIKTSTSVTLPDVIDPAYAKTLVMLVIPVIMIILMLRGWNLISTLIVCDLVGFVLCLVFGFLDVPTLFSATGPIGAGLTGMLNVICFSFFMFALLEMLKRSGVFDMLLEKLSRASKTPRQAELVTILLSVIGSVAIGAASISILFVGPVVRQLMQTHNIERTRGSNLMDGISTGLAGIVPYNPVGLNAVSLAIASGVVSESFSFLDYVPYNFQSWLLILLFDPALSAEIKDRFYYVDADPEFGKRLFFENSGGSLRLKASVEAQAKYQAFPDCPERLHDRSRALKKVQLHGIDDIMHIVFGASGGALISEMTASQAMFQIVGAILENCPGKSAVTSVLEHPSAYDAVKYYCGKTGKEFRVAQANPKTGGIDIEEIRRVVSPDTCLLSIMYASNITGSIMDMAGIVKAAREINPDIYIVTDAVQHAPHAVLDVDALGVDGATFAPYKFFGTRGMGYGYVSDRVAKLPHRKVLQRPADVWELGSPTPGNFAAMSAVVDYVCWLGGHFIESDDRRTLFVTGMEHIHLQERALLHTMLEGTQNVPGLRHIPGVHVYVDTEDLTHRDLIVAMGIDGLDMTRCVEEYQKRGVTTFERVNTSVYSKRIVEAVGLTGAIRVSPLHCHTVADIETYLRVTQELAQTFAQ